MLDMLAAISRKDYEDRRRRQGEGIKRAKEAGNSRVYCDVFNNPVLA